MHKTIGLVVASVASLGAGAAIIWQTEQGWGRIFASSRTTANESDFYDAIPVSETPRLIASNSDTPSVVSGRPVPLVSAQNEPATDITPASTTAGGSQDPWNAWAMQSNLQSSQSEPASRSSDASDASRDPWSELSAPAAVANTESSQSLQSIPGKAATATESPASDPWGAGNVAAAHEQPASLRSSIEMVEHQVPSAPTSNDISHDPFYQQAASLDRQSTAGLAASAEREPASEAMALFPDPAAPAAVPIAQPENELEPAPRATAVEPLWGMFPEPASKSTQAASALPLFPDPTDTASEPSRAPIRLTQAEQEPGPAPAALPPQPIPMLDQPHPTPAPGSPAPSAAPMPAEPAVPSGPTPDAFFDFGGPAATSPAPASTPAPLSAPTPSPLSNPFSSELGPTPKPAPLPGFLPDVSPSPVPTPRSEPLPSQPPAVGSPRSLSDDAMIGTGVISGDVPRVMQKPELSLEKKAPSTAALGEPMVYTIEVTNTGTIIAKEVTLEDEIPKGTKLTGTIPQAHMKEKTLVWKLGDLKPGETQLVKVRVIPLEEGDIGSVATVHFVTEVAAATRITAPVLQLVMEAVPQVAIGEDATIRYKIKNVGEGTAFNVTLYSLIPQNFKHPEGTDLEMPLGNLDAGQTKEVALVAVAEAAGRGTNEAQVKASGGVTAQGKADIEVIDSILTLERTGPARRFVGHSANYTITVANQSIRDIEQATIVETVPQGFEFISATSNGKFNPSTRSVTWNFSKLRSKTQESMQVSLKPDRVGEFTSEVAVVSKDGHKANVVAKTLVEGFASLKIEDPEGRGLVGIGEQVSLRFKIRNRGSAPANSVQLSCNVPPSFQVISAKGPTPYRQDGNRLIFEPVAAIAPDQDMQVDFVLVARNAGNAHLSISVNAEEMKDPLTHEENVVVYNPNE